MATIYKNRRFYFKDIMITLFKRENGFHLELPSYVSISTLCSLTSFFHYSHDSFTAQKWAFPRPQSKFPGKELIDPYWVIWPLLVRITDIHVEEVDLGSYCVDTVPRTRANASGRKVTVNCENTFNSDCNLNVVHQHPSKGLPLSHWFLFSMHGLGARMICCGRCY